MKLCFDSIAEVKEFVGGLKGTRGKKDDENNEGAATVHTAAAPLQPPQGAPAQTFQPGPAPNAAFSPPAFPGANQPLIDPAVQALVNRITARMDSALSSGATKLEDMLNWFRQQCGPEASGATLDQIKTAFMPKLSVPTLENIAKLMSA